MSQKHEETRLKNKKSVTVAVNMKLRRCEIRLRRFKIPTNSGVPLKKTLNSRQESNLKGQQNSLANKKLINAKESRSERSLQTKTLSKPNIENKFNSQSAKADNPQISKNSAEPKTAADNKTQTNRRTKKCLVKLQRVSAPKEKNMNKSHAMSIVSQRTFNTKVTGTFFSLRKCCVKLKKLKSSDFNKNLNNSILRPSRAEGLINRKSINKNVSFNPVASNVSFEDDDMIITVSQPTKTTSPRNLANRPNDIAELLSGEDEDLFENQTNIEQIPVLLEIPKDNDIDNTENMNKTAMKNKFFHKNVLNLNEDNHKNIKPAVKKLNNPKKLRNPKKSKILKAKQKVSFAQNDVYEFLSQSQTSDSDGAKDKDVAADIIKKLIEQGKVVVTKNRKGRPCITHKNRKVQKLKNQTKKTQVKSLNNKNKNTKETHIDNINDNILNDLDDVEQLPELPVISSDNTNIQQENTTKDTRNKNAANSDATFSNLARSILVHQIENRQAARRKLSLQSYYSTPFKPQQNSLQLPIGADLSPIQQALAEKSKNSAETINTVESLQHSLQEELPTFSGNSNSKNATRKTLIRPSTSKSMSFSLTSFGSRSNKEQTQKNSLSSFSSNDSNAENQPPQVLSTISFQSQNNIENENNVIHSARQSPNPRRTLTNRSPLKAINIIDVVTLPPYQGPFSRQSKTNDNNLNEKTKDDSKLFGFEEYLDKNETTENESFINEHSLTKTSKANLSRRLRKLKQWRPKANPLKRDAGNNTTITGNFFDNDFNDKTRGNRNIKDMLCSTMINTKKVTIQEDTMNASSTLGGESISNNNDEDSYSDDSDFEKSKERKTAELFGDPENSFDHKQIHRTYQRPFKRKRKLINQFSEIFDSDEHSDEEEDSHNNSIVEKKQRKVKKRQCRAESPQNEELEEFVNKFNSELKEAEDYELIVE